MFLYIYCDCLLINKVLFVLFVLLFLIFFFLFFFLFFFFFLFLIICFICFIVFILLTCSLLIINYFMLISIRCIQEIYLEFLTLIVVATPLETYSYPLYHTIVGYFLNQFQIYLAPQNIQCYLCCN